MGWIIGGIILPSCLAAAWLIVYNPVRQVFEEMRVSQARIQFHRQREWLEVRFLKALGQVGSVERLRWENARWHDQVYWAHDRQTRRLVALVEIHFESNPFDDSPATFAEHATALFEYRKGNWIADGKRLDAIRPDEAFLRHRRFEQVAPPPPHS